MLLRTEIQSLTYGTLKVVVIKFNPTSFEH